MSAIEDLERKVQGLRARLSAAEESLRKARLAAAPVKRGDIVRGTRDGKLYRVAAVDVRWTPKPWVDGNPERKDGTFGTAVRHIYGDWEVVEANP
jgi:hypothetical protein